MIQHAADISGVPIYTETLATGLQRLGHTIWIICPDGPMVERYRQAGLHVIIKSPAGDLDLRYIRWLRDWLLQQHIDVLHANMLKTSIHGLMAARWAHIPCRVDHIHGTLIDWEVPWYKKYLNVTMHTLTARICATDVVALTPSIAKQLIRQEYLPADRVAVIANGLDVQSMTDLDRSYLRHRYDYSNQELLIGTFCRLSVEKSVMTCIEGWPEIIAQLPMARLVIMGDGPERSNLELRAQQLGIDDTVRFVGFIPEDNKYDAIASLDVYAMPSTREGFGLTMLEAMACRVPVIATNLPVLQDIVSDSQSAVLYTVADSRDFAQKLVALLQQPRSTRRHLADTAFTAVSTTYSLAQFISAYDQLYAHRLNQQLESTRSL